MLFGQFAATGHTNTPVVFRNLSNTLCYFEGYPDVTILDSAGNALAQASGSGQRGTFFDVAGLEVPVLMETGTQPLVATQGFNPPQVHGQASVSIEWYDCRSPMAAKLALDMPAAGGRLVIAYTIQAPTSPICDSSATPVEALWRGPISPTGFVWPPRPTYITVAIGFVAPASAKRGSTLVYYVTVRNTSETDYQLVPCPDYEELLLWKEPLIRYQLNCGPVGHIAPNASVTFEMRLPVPFTVSAGPNILTWALLDNRVVPPANAQTPIDIT